MLTLKWIDFSSFLFLVFQCDVGSSAEDDMLASLLKSGILN